MAMLAENRRASFDYEFLEFLEAGIELLGFEVKSAKAGNMSIAGAFAIIRGNELWLTGATITPYQAGNTSKGYDASRIRRLLMRREEIALLIGKMKERGLTLVPIKVYTKGNRVKVELGLGRGKRGPDKRALIRKRETKREIERTLKI